MTTIKQKFGRVLAHAAAAALPYRLFRSPAYFDVWEGRGYHIVPANWTSPLPVIGDLPSRIWSSPSDAIGIDFREEQQLKLLDRFRTSYKSEYDLFPRTSQNDPNLFHLGNGFFEKVDAEILYCMVRNFRPSRIVEIGSGMSTKVACQAILQNRKEDAAYRGRVTAIEPYPSRLTADMYPGILELITKRIESLPASEIVDSLEAGDILFIDSSHVCKTGSDVVYEFCELLPRIRPGVLVHVHDIFLPYEYPESWVRDRRVFYSEQYLLQAFLSFNNAFRVVWSSFLMQQKHSAALAGSFASYHVDITPPGTFLPGSFWLERIA